MTFVLRLVTTTELIVREPLQATPAGLLLACDSCSVIHRGSSVDVGRVIWEKCQSTQKTCEYSPAVLYGLDCGYEELFSDLPYIVALSKNRLIPVQNPSQQSEQRGRLAL